MTPIDMIGPSLELQEKIASLLKISKERVRASITMKPTGTEDRPQVKLTFEILIDGMVPQGEAHRRIEAFIKAITFSELD